MAAKDINLTTLNKFMDSTLTRTELVRNVLQNECNQANYVLSSWKIVTEIDEKIEENCTCLKEENNIEHAADIAHEIDKTLAKVKELRQKTKKCGNDSRRNNIQVLRSSSLDTKKCDISNTKFENYSAVKKALNFNTTKSAPKNFIAQNKLHVKVISQQNSEMIKSKNNKESDNKICLTKTISDLDILIQKVSMNTLKSNTSSSSTEIQSNCSCQRNNEKVIRKKMQISFKMADVLNQFGIPNNLLKTFRVCHSFMASCDTDNSPQYQTTSQNFLDVLGKRNMIQSSKLSKSANHVRKLVPKFFDLYKNLDEIKFCDYLALKQMTRKYNELSDLMKNYNIPRKNYYKVIRICETNEDYQYIKRGWLSNGLWNWPNNSYSMFSQTESINYSKDEKILKFFNLLQQYQLTAFQNNLNEIILSTIIPNIEQNKNFTHEEILEVCKMIYVIVQTLNPKTLIVIKTQT